MLCVFCALNPTARGRNNAVPLADMCRKRLADMPNGAHMEIGTYGDLDTMHWVQNEPWAADVLDCHVTYGAAPALPPAGTPECQAIV